MKRTYLIGLLLVMTIICLSQALSKGTGKKKKDNQYYFGVSLPNLDSIDKDKFLKGEELFRHLFVLNNRHAEFNALSCVSCHNTPIAGGSGIYPNTFVPFYSNNDSLETIFHRFSLQDNKTKENPLPRNYALRKTPSLFGLGLLEQMDLQIMLANDDPLDLNNDGVSGRIRYIDKERRQIGRFGWKASVSSIGDFVNMAFESELGLSSKEHYESINGFSYKEVSSLVTLYMEYLSPPYDVRDSTNYHSSGLKIFTQIGCSKCHLDYAETKSPDKILNNISFRPFTDLLLHDMIRDFPVCHTGDTNSLQYEYRTPSLWGLNSTGPPYMHDGSASSIEEAINLHNGEGATAKNLFGKLNERDLHYLMMFLKDL